MGYNILVIIVCHLAAAPRPLFDDEAAADAIHRCRDIGTFHGLFDGTFHGTFDGTFDGAFDGTFDASRRCLGGDGAQLVLPPIPSLRRSTTFFFGFGRIRCPMGPTRPQMEKNDAGAAGLKLRNGEPCLPLRRPETCGVDPVGHARWQHPGRAVLQPPVGWELCRRAF